MDGLISGIFMSTVYFGTSAPTLKEVYGGGLPGERTERGFWVYLEVGKRDRVSLVSGSVCCRVELLWGDFNVYDVFWEGG